MRAIGITDFLNKSFDVYKLEGEWLESFGEPEKNFKMSITGDSGAGKTDLTIKFIKNLCLNYKTKADYYSFEEGISKTLQKAIERNDLEPLKGRIMFIAAKTFDDLMTRLSRRGSARIAVIDSQDYAELTAKQYKQLVKAFPKKSFIVISWSKNDKPKNQAARDIEYMCDIKVLVKNGKAFIRSRYGGNIPFVIFKKHHEDKEPQKTLFDNGND